DRDGGDREYRRRDGAAAGDKKDGAPSGEYRPRFAGVGRGAPRQ
ncbi:40s ribosomal protein s10, partial [Moesziomyces antarcticus T-34]